METNFDNAVVAGALSPLVASFDEPALRSLVQFRADERTQQRYEELSEKASDGTLSPNERRAFESMIGTSAIVAVLQAEAEKLLASRPPGNG